MDQIFVAFSGYLKCKRSFKYKIRAPIQFSKAKSVVQSTKQKTWQSAVLDFNKKEVPQFELWQ